MRLLLDTHIAVWAISDDPALAAEVKALIADPANDVFVSVVSLWEIALKNSTRRDAAGVGVSAVEASAQFTLADFEPLLLKSRHAFAVEDLARHHGDPFDRMLVAQALVESCRLVTHDKQLAAYGDHVMLV